MSTPVGHLCVTMLMASSAAVLFTAGSCLRDAGSILLAPTKTGCTTRLDSNKARQWKLAGLGRFLHVYGDLRRFASLPVTKSLDHLPGEIVPKVSKPRDTPQVSPAMEMVGNQQAANTAFFPVWRRLPVASSIATRGTWRSCECRIRDQRCQNGNRPPDALIRRAAGGAQRTTGVLNELFSLIVLFYHCLPMQRGSEEDVERIDFAHVARVPVRFFVEI